MHRVPFRVCKAVTDSRIHLFRITIPSEFGRRHKMQFHWMNEVYLLHQSSGHRHIEHIDPNGKLEFFVKNKCFSMGLFSPWIVPRNHFYIQMHRLESLHILKSAQIGSTIQHDFISTAIPAKQHTITVGQCQSAALSRKFIVCNETNDSTIGATDANLEERLSCVGNLSKYSISLSLVPVVSMMWSLQLVEFIRRVSTYFIFRRQSVE